MCHNVSNVLRPFLNIFSGLFFFSRKKIINRFWQAQKIFQQRVNSPQLLFHITNMYKNVCIVLLLVLATAFAGRHHVRPVRIQQESEMLGLCEGKK